MQLFLFVLSLILAATLTRWTRDIAVSHNWVSAPVKRHHIHNRPVPRLGGVAIFLTLCILVFVARNLPGHLGARGVYVTQSALRLLGPASVIFLLGLWDDIRGLGPYLKFAVEIAAAVYLFYSGFGISKLSLLVRHPDIGTAVGLPLTIIWVLGITNAFNLIDGLDGLAAGSALFSTFVICVLALVHRNGAILFLSLALSGAIAGVLRYNFNPATIYLGDCGSLLIGFLLSAIALAGSEKSPTMVAVAIPVVALGLPILDVGVAVIRRFLSGKKLFIADREHIHHKLLSRGVPHRQAVLMLYGVSACFALLSLFLLTPGGEAIAMVLVVAGMGVLIGVQQLRYPEFSELGRLASRTLNQRQIIANNVGVRRAADVLASSASVADICQTLRGCLERGGFDGISLQLDCGIPAAVPLQPFTMNDQGELEFRWNSSPVSAETKWTMSFGLHPKDRAWQGRCTLHANVSPRPMLMDLSLFTSSGFSTALAEGIDCAIRKHTILNDRGAASSSGALLGAAAAAADGAFLGKVS